MKKNKNNQNHSFLSCCDFCFPSCTLESEEIPINKKNTSYKIISKSRNKACISFPGQILETKMDFILNITHSQNEKKDPFSYYESFPRNKLFTLEKYPFYMVTKVNDNHMKLSFEQNEFNLKMDINNSELSHSHLLNIFLSFLKFKFAEILDFNPTFSLFLHMPKDPLIKEQPESLEDFSDFLLKFDQSISIQQKKKII